MKKKVSVTIDKQVFEKSKSLGINVSKVCENTLISLIEAINNKEMAGPLGFEPRTFSLEGESWNDFREWLIKKKYNPRYTTTLFNYAQKYAKSLETGDLGAVRDLPDSMRPNVLKALAAFAKFTGQYKEFQKLRERYQLHWGGRSKDDVIIDHISRDKDSEEIWNWIRTVKVARPELSLFLDFMAATGLRFIEAFNSYNLIISLHATGKLYSDYYSEDKVALEHFRFKEMFLRNSKKAFFSFMPRQMVEQVGNSVALASPDAIQHLVTGNARFGDIREAHGTFMTKFLKESEIDFLHGRVTSSVFMANYFNPSLVADLRKRAFLGIDEITEKVKL